MIHARQGLLSSARGFFEQELRGLYRWDQVTHHDPEPMPPGMNGRRNPLGKYREKVVLSFDGFRLEVASSEEEPPLGRIDLYENGELRAGGPLDAQVWARLGSVIRENAHVSG